MSRNPCQDSLPTTGIHATMCCACQTLLLFRRFLLVPIHSRPCSIGVGSRVPTTRRACAVSSPWPWSRAFSNPPFRRSAENRSLGRGQLSCFGGVSSSANDAPSADRPCIAVDGMNSSEIVGHYVLGVIFLTYLLLGCLRRRSVHKGPHPPCRPVALDPLKGRGALLARIVTQSLAG